MTNTSSQALVAANVAKLMAVGLIAGAALSSCAPTTMPPQQVQASNPTVTYKYRGDQELVTAEQNASAFCTRYQGVPRTVSLTNDSDGNRVVVFDCVPPAPAPAPVAAAPVVVPAPNPLVYSYTTDQQLIDASRNAQAYCMSRGSTQTTSTVVTNANGSRTITFQCGPA
jgi:hypothetical protein